MLPQQRHYYVYAATTPLFADYVGLLYTKSAKKSSAAYSDKFRGYMFKEIVTKLNNYRHNFTI